MTLQNIENLLKDAITKYPHFPSIAELSDLGYTKGIMREKEIPHERPCDECGGIGWFQVFKPAVGFQPQKESTASCHKCERGRYLRKRAKHPIVTLREATRAGYIISKRVN